MRCLLLPLFLLLTFPILSQNPDFFDPNCENCVNCLDCKNTNIRNRNRNVDCSRYCNRCSEIGCREQNPLQGLNTSYVRCFTGCNSSNPCMPFPPDNTCTLPPWGQLIAFGSSNTTRMKVQILDKNNKNILRKVKWSVRPVGHFFDAAALKKMGLKKNQNVFFFKYRVKSKYRKSNTPIRVIGEEFDKKGNKIEEFKVSYQNISVSKKNQRVKK